MDTNSANSTAVTTLLLLLLLMSLLLGCGIVLGRVSLCVFTSSLGSQLIDFSSTVHRQFINYSSDV